MSLWRTSVDIDVLDFNGVMFNAIRFHKGNVVIVDGESEERAAGNCENAQPVPLSLLDIYNSVVD